MCRTPRLPLHVCQKVTPASRQHHPRGLSSQLMHNAALQPRYCLPTSVLQNKTASDWLGDKHLVMQRPIDSKLVEVYYPNYDSFFTASLLDYDEGPPPCRACSLFRCSCVFRLMFQVIHPPPSGTGTGTLACLNCHSSRCRTRHQIPINTVRLWVPPQSDASMQYSEGERVEVRGFCF